MIKDIKMNELGEIRTEDEAQYHAFVWSMIRPKTTIEIQSKQYEAPRLITMSFGDVVDIKKMLSQMTLEDQIKSVSRVYGIEEEVLINMKVTTFFSLFNYVVKELTAIIETEQKTLTGSHKSEMIQAGVEKLKQFGVLTTIDSLAGGNVLKWQSILEERYSTVYTKMYMNKVRSEVEERYSEIMERKKNRRKQRK